MRKRWSYAKGDYVIVDAAPNPKQSGKITARLRYCNTPSPQKPRNKRYIEWLELAVKGPISIHCVGGYAFKGDLQKLVAKGFLSQVRSAYAKGWGGDYDINRTYLKITDAGLRHLQDLEK